MRNCDITSPLQNPHIIFILALHRGVKDHKLLWNLDPEVELLLRHQLDHSSCEASLLTNHNLRLLTRVGQQRPDLLPGLQIISL